MIEFNGKKLCESCFEEITSQPCPHCGFDPAVPAADHNVLKPGSILLGKYIVGRTIGKGGFGITYLAYDTTTGKKAAIKEYYPYGLALRTSGNPTVAVSTAENASVFKSGAERFYEEAKLVSRFNGNPNIVAVHEFFYENDTVYFSMEYLSGRTLKDYVQNTGTLNAAQTLFLAQNVSNALMAAHSASVLHRDISPDNIMLCSNGEIKLIDFGAARQVVAEHSQSFSVILKPGFAPLEQYKKKGDQGPWTDIYSLGATLYYALTGDIPDDPMTRLDEDDNFTENKFNINEELWNIIVKATMLKIPDRYADIFEMRRALNQVSFPPEPIFVPHPQESAPAEGFRTAMPFGASTATIQRTENVQQPVVTMRTEEAPTQERPAGFFAAHKKPIIAAAGGTAAVAAAAVIIAVALNSGGKQNSGEMVTPVEPVRNEYSQQEIPPESSDPKPETTTTTASTTKAVTTTAKPVTTTTTAKPAVTTTTKATTTTAEPVTTTTKPVTTTTTAKPVESKPEEVTSVQIGGKSYSTDLKSLDLSGKGLKNSDVKNLKYMKNLDTLILNNNSLTDISFVKEMPKLKYLYFENNNVSDISAVKGLSDLVGISGNGNPITDISALKGKKKLDNVWFCNTKVTDISPLSGCTKITQIGFNECNIGSSFSAVKNMSKLTMVCFHNCGISDISPLADKPALTKIYLGYNWISDPSPLRDCKSISELYLDNNSINDDSISDFAGLTVDGIVDVSGNGLTQEQADEICEWLSGNLEMLYY
ncbi:MAG: protein kinase [Oscillospiraceae bacterium]|nr:protein kinase [Oscillospiraceae bacterium]